MGYDSPPGNEIDQLIRLIKDTIARVSELERPSGTQTAQALKKIQDILNGIIGQTNSIVPGYVQAGTDLIAGANISAGNNLTVGTSIFNLYGKNNPVTTSFVAAYFNGPDGRIAATPSSVRYKQDISSVDMSDAVRAILTMPLVQYRYINAVEELGEDAPTMVGPIAEAVAKTALSEWVYSDEDGRPEGVNIERLTIPLIATVQTQAAQIKALMARLDAAGI